MGLHKRCNTSSNQKEVIAPLLCRICGLILKQKARWKCAFLHHIWPILFFYYSVYETNLLMGSCNTSLSNHGNIFTSLEATLVHYCWLFKLQLGWTTPTIPVKESHLISFSQQYHSSCSLRHRLFLQSAKSYERFAIVKFSACLQLALPWRKKHKQGMWDGSPLCSAISSSFGYSSCQLTKSLVTALQHGPRDSQHRPEPKFDHCKPHPACYDWKAKFWWGYIDLLYKRNQILGNIKQDLR